ncbi:MAG: protein SanA [Mesonia sp.]|nr:protein SanA [Mesonia sp.]MAQ39868.1 protein SanA [Mesonia sp.]MBJ98154.1 protein SanA [Flavobacteriaceae bacterium]
MFTVIIGVLIIDTYVSSSSSDKIYKETNKIPHKRVGLLLGTSKFLSNHQINLYYKYRIEAAAELFKAGKIEFILISGDNGSKNYNEPKLMKEDLMNKGIPEEKIYLDYAGFRTLDSVLRAKKVFGQNSFTIISQEFHNERAVFLAKSFQINAIAFNAKDVSINDGLKTQLREKLARSKMILDLIFNVEPKYLGKKIVIE